LARQPRAAGLKRRAGKDRRIACRIANRGPIELRTKRPSPDGLGTLLYFISVEGRCALLAAMRRVPITWRMQHPLPSDEIAAFASAVA
jgi:hypothetical protein